MHLEAPEKWNTEIPGQVLRTQFLLIPPDSMTIIDHLRMAPGP
jgi:hypothetical protein